ncbi:MAG: sensor histidine kinase [Oliverpabstia sp.]
MQKSYENSFYFAADTVQNQLEQIKQLSDYIFFDEDIKELLTREDKNSYSFIKLQEQIEEQLKNYLYFTSYGDFRTVQLYGQYGKALSLSLDNPLLTYNEEIIESEIQQKASSNGTFIEIDSINTRYLTSNVSHSYASYTIIRPIMNKHFSQNIGGMFLTISPELFSSIDSLYGQDGDQKIYLLNHENIPMNFDPVEENLAFLENLDLTSDVAYECTQDGQTIMFYPLADTNWKIIGILSSQELIEKNKTIFYTTAVSFFLALLLTSLLSRFLSLRIFHPLEVLQEAVAKIQCGETNTRVPILSDDEIGALSMSVNQMLNQLEDSHKKQLIEQKKLQDARYKALQTSINPHFLYNTLNTIQWLAAIQKADNIKTMAETLSRLLRSTVKQDPDSHCIQTELQILKDYLFIQQLAYSHRFSIQWLLDDQVESYPCIPFILQPLAENSILHGLMPKKTAGIIRITTKKATWMDQEVVEIEIWDNGDGIPPEKIASILSSSNSDKNKNGLNGIGINNVNERLILTYGSSFGLQISSDGYSYTSVTVHIPSVSRVPIDNENNK